jgi:hypothetical protein
MVVEDFEGFVFGRFQSRPLRTVIDANNVVTIQCRDCGLVIDGNQICRQIVEMSVIGREDSVGTISMVKDGRHFFVLKKEAC